MTTTFAEKNRCRGCAHLKHGETCMSTCECKVDSLLLPGVTFEPYVPKEAIRGE